MCFSFTRIKMVESISKYLKESDTFLKTFLGKKGTHFQEVVSRMKH